MENPAKKKAGGETPSAEIFAPHSSEAGGGAAGPCRPAACAPDYARSSSRTFFADSGITVPGPKMALAPLSSRNL